MVFMRRAISHRGSVLKISRRESLWSPSGWYRYPGSDLPDGPLVLPKNVPWSDRAFGDGITAEWLEATGSLSESIVFQGVWIPLVEFSEFLQAAFRKVVEGFFRPVLAFRIVEPFD